MTAHEQPGGAPAPRAFQRGRGAGAEIPAVNPKEGAGERHPAPEYSQSLWRAGKPCRQTTIERAPPPVASVLRRRSVARARARRLRLALRDCGGGEARCRRALPSRR